jgi:hypothetical protein
MDRYGYVRKEMDTLSGVRAYMVTMYLQVDKDSKYKRKWLVSKVRMFTEIYGKDRVKKKIALRASSVKRIY